MKRLQKLNLMIKVSIAFITSLAQSFTKLIFSVFYPNPGICRADNDYFIVSSFFLLPRPAVVLNLKK
ncbi:hypothetical protein [Ferruginibacter sp.]